MSVSMGRFPGDRGPRGDGDGARTGPGGTPFAVDLSGDRPAMATAAVFLAGPVIWSVHFLVVYLVTEAGCTGDGPGLSAFDPPVPTIVTLAATAVAAAAALAAAVWAYRRWRQGQGRPAADDVDASSATPPERRVGGPLAFAGFMLSLLAVVTVLLVGLPALVLPSC
jgi:hypothetical protein